MQRVLVITDHGGFGLDLGRRRVLAWQDLADPAGDDGADLERWLAIAPRRRLRILVDSAAEAFHCQAVPPLRGRDRLRLQGRIAARHFAADEPCFSRRLGRAELLVAGIAEPGLLQPWLAAVNRAGTPLAGIHSLARAGEGIVHRLRLQREPDLLLLAWRPDGALRQTLYRHGRLRFSRLVTATAGAAESTHRLRDELERLLAYLRHGGAVGSAVRIVLIEPPEGLQGAPPVEIDPHDRLSSACVARALGMAVAPPASIAGIALHAHALVRAYRPGNDYATPAQLRPWRLRRAARGLDVLAACLVLAVPAWSLTHVLSSHADADGNTKPQQQVIAASVALPTDIDLVAIRDWLVAGRLPASRDPQTAMAVLGDVLSGQTEVRLARFHWQGGERPGAGERLHVEGRIAAGADGPGAGMDRLLDRLAQSPAIERVEITRRPQSVHHGKAGDVGRAAPAPADAPFALRLELAGVSP